MHQKKAYSKTIDNKNLRIKKHIAIIFALCAFLLSIVLIQACRVPDISGLARVRHEDEINYIEGEEIMLPEPATDSNFSLEQSLLKRRSVRTFSDKQIEIEKVSQLLWAAQGITKKDTGFRTSPSAGALFPLDVFLLNSQGVFHYIPEGHRLLMMDNKDMQKDLYTACYLQSPVLSAAINIVITAVYERTTVKYGDRGIRYVDIEAGHCCQNILLQAVALDLGAVPIGAFIDTQIQNILGLPEEYVPLYVVPVGYP